MKPFWSDKVIWIMCAGFNIFDDWTFQIVFFYDFDGQTSIGKPEFQSFGSTRSWAWLPESFFWHKIDRQMTFYGKTWKGQKRTMLSMGLVDNWNITIVQANIFFIQAFVIKKLSNLIIEQCNERKDHFYA